MTAFVEKQNGQKVYLESFGALVVKSAASRNLYFFDPKIHQKSSFLTGKPGCFKGQINYESLKVCNPILEKYFCQIFIGENFPKVRGEN